MKMLYWNAMAYLNSELFYRWGWENRDLSKLFYFTTGQLKLECKQTQKLFYASHKFTYI